MHTASDPVQPWDPLRGASVALTVRRLERSSRRQRTVLFAALDRRRGCQAFERLDPALQSELLEDLPPDLVGPVFDDLDPDVRAEVLQRLPAGVAQRLLAGLAPAERALTTALLQWPAGCVGRRMSPEVVALRRGLSAADALAQVRAQEPQAESVYTLCVVDEEQRLVGVVSLRRLLVADPGEAIEAVAAEPVALAPHVPEEDAARTLLAHGFAAMPVVDSAGRLLGLFTADDAYRVAEREQDEDAARAGGSEPLDRPYLLIRPWTLYRRRIVWLLVLIAAATLTVSVLDFFEQALLEVVALALFIPLLIGTAGNTGAQAATTCVRAMALGDVTFGDLRRVAGKECLTGALLGATLGAVAFVPAALSAGREVATVVALTLVVICTMAATVGVLVPMVARRLGMDPAVVSAPFITTFTDAAGLVVYFLIATAVLGLR
jgi:magnesium transporter